MAINEIIAAKYGHYTWLGKPSNKAKRYIRKFWDRTCRGAKIIAKVEGNHGTYTVSIAVTEDRIDIACIGISMS